MKVFGQFKCVFCDGTGIEPGRDQKCRCCNNGISNHRQEYRDGNLLLETCLCNINGPHRKTSKWCVEVCTLQRTERSAAMYHEYVNNVPYVWCHDYEFDAWSGSLKHAYKKALKNAKEALARRTKNNVHAMIMDLLEA